MNEGRDSVETSYEPPCIEARDPVRHPLIGDLIPIGSGPIGV